MDMWKSIKLNKGLRRLDDSRLCPLPESLDLSSPKRAMIFAPHPDDETLGCGGTLARLAGHCDVQAVLVTDGSGAGQLPPEAVQLRREEFRQALAVLGVTDIKTLDYPDGEFRASHCFAEEMSDLLRGFQPEWVFLPSPLDYHRDHSRIGTALEPACRQCGSVTHVLFYEVWAPVQATHVVDITDNLNLKMEALHRHKTAMACGDYMRAVEGLNRFRGLYLGRDRHAEAFRVEFIPPSVGLVGQLKALGMRLIRGMKKWASR